MSNSKNIPFKVSARTAKLIGLENFSNEEGAVIELVKNTYDADAKNCLIIFDLKFIKKIDKENNEIEVFDKNNSSLYIIDNGIGMNDEIIQNQWMTIGTHNKLYEHTSEGGRVKTGAKGIGRFALNRLGMLTNLLTIPESAMKREKELFKKAENICFEWTVDWKDFDQAGATVSDIEAVLSEKENTNLTKELLNKFSSYVKVKQILKKINFESGTIIEIRELNDDWNDEKLRKLFGNLEMLLPPKEQSDFTIDLFSLNDLENFGNVTRAYYDDYDYRIKASFNQKAINVEISRNELDIETLENKYLELFDLDTMKNSPYTIEDFKKEKISWTIPIENLMTEKVDINLLERIGEFNFTFYFIKNTISDDKEDGDLKKYPYKRINSATRKSWLKKFGGIKIFRDDFRIRPYGEKGDDWLRLGERQAQSPGGAGQRLGGYKIRPNQIAGTINISRIHNESFQDKSGREGLIENDEFELFKNIIIEIISLFEKDRNVIMHNLSILHNIRNEEVEKVRRAKEYAEKIKKEREEREEREESEKNTDDESNTDSHNRFHNNTSHEDRETQENMADAFLILEKENEKKDEELRLLRSFASVGLIISSFAHEVKGLRTKLIPRTEHLLKVLKTHLDETELSEKTSKYDDPFYMIQLMNEDDTKLKHWLDYSLNTIKIDKRQRTNLSINQYFESFKSTWSKALEQRNIELELNKLSDEEIMFKAFEVNMDSIFNNLLSNSINAHLGYNKEEKKIKITWKKQADELIILFADNGKGLDAKYWKNPDDIFNLNESGKIDNKGKRIGTGLGLYIVKSIIDDYNNSSISIVEIQNGLTFKIIFKLQS